MVSPTTPLMVRGCHGVPDYTDFPIAGQSPTAQLYGLPLGESQAGSAQERKTQV